jgi:hypothetical protein
LSSNRLAKEIPPVSVDGSYRRIARHRVADFRKRAAIEALAFRCGATYDSYLATEPDRRILWAADGSGAVGYVSDRHYLHIAGGLLAPPADKPGLVAGLVRRADLGVVDLRAAALLRQAISRFASHDARIAGLAGGSVLSDLSNAHGALRRPPIETALKSRLRCGCGNKRECRRAGRRSIR